MRVLHVASECAPYAKTGGLADVLGALPHALGRLGLDVTVVMPRYRSIDPERFGLARWLRTLPVRIGGETVEIGFYEGTPPGGARVRLLLVEHAPSFDRDGLYGPPGGGDFADNARRFAVLGASALAIAEALGAWPDVLHGHDWQAGPSLLYARQFGFRAPPRTVFTVHNLAYQGLFPSTIVEELGLPPELYQPDGFEFYGQVSLLKAGLALADRITAVSPCYAEEIKTPEHGVGLDGLLRARADQLVGILNGADYDVWDPEVDPHLPARYSAARLDGKRICKAALQRELGLPERPRAPLCGSISRLAEQKGFDLVCAALPKLLAETDLQYVILGSGDASIERALRQLAARHPTRLAVRIAYDEALAHRIEAGCDLYVMPSRFEPCGLNQIYSLRYGTPPIVRATGGLDDTIVDYDARSRTGTGFKFRPYTPAALDEAWRRALGAYQVTDEFTALVRRAMAQDFSWAASARRYLELYRQLVG
jgi:starch synthase